MLTFVDFSDNVFPLTLLGFLVVLTLLFLSRSRYQTKGKPLPPCLPSLPIVGSIPFLGLAGKDDHLRYQELAEKYGNIYCFWLGKKLVVVISGYDNIRTALLDQPVIMAGRPNGDMHHIQYVNPHVLGLIEPCYTSQEWKKERQVSLAILKSFGFGRSMMENRIQREVDSLLSHLRNFKGGPQDITQTLTISVCNVICGLVLGKPYSFDDCDELKYILDTIEKELKLVPQLAVVDFFPVLAYLPSYKRAAKHVIEYLGIVSEFLNRFLKEHKEEYTTGKEDDFIDAFWGRLGTEYDSERLYYIVRDLFMAGTETTSATLQWAVVYMANNPNIQRRVQEELDKKIGEQRPASLEDKARLPYTEAVVLEIQRLASLVPGSLPHKTLSDTELCGYYIPKDTMVSFNLWSVLRDPLLWPEPDKFRPERFLDDNGVVVHKSELIPFSLGRRSCLGEVMARHEIFLFFCGLMQNFTIRLPDGVEKLDEKGVTTLTRTPLPFKVVLDSRV